MPMPTYVPTYANYEYSNYCILIPTIYFREKGTYMLNTKPPDEDGSIEIMEPIEVSTTSRAVTSARRKPDLALIESGHLQAADQHPAMVYLASLAPGSRRGVRSSL